MNLEEPLVLTSAFDSVSSGRLHNSLSIVVFSVDSSREVSTAELGSGTGVAEGCNLELDAERALVKFSGEASLSVGVCSHL